MAALPVIVPSGTLSNTESTWTDEAGAAATALLIDELTAGDTDYIRTSLVQSVFKVDLQDTPSDFLTMNSLSVEARHSRGTVEAGNAGGGDDTWQLYAYIVDSTETVALAGGNSTPHNGQLINSSTIGYLAKTQTIPFTYVNQTATKAQWDGARLYVEAVFTVTSTTDSHRIWLDFIRLVNGDYDVAAAGTDLTKRGAGTPVTSGTTWTTTTNAVDGTPPANPATYAVWTSSTSGATGYIEVTGYDFSSIPDTATLLSVTARLRHFENNTTRISTVTFQGYAGATPLGSAISATKATSARDDSGTIPITLAQLKAATFKMRATAVRAAVTQSATFNVDLIDVTATYQLAVGPSGGSTEVIQVPADGAGQKAIARGSTEIIQVPADGAGRKAVSGGSTELIGVASEGGGSAGAPPELSGGSEANVNVVESGGGRKVASGGSTSFPKVDTEAGGQKIGKGGVTEFVQTGADGAGRKAGRGSVTEIVQVGAEGGTGTTTRQGGSEANINVDSSGTGVEKSQGGSTARVGADAEAAGWKAVSLGVTSFPKVNVEATGFKTARGSVTEIIQVGTDAAGAKRSQSGSTEIIGVDAEAAGRKAIARGSETNLNILTDGAGRKAAARGATEIVQVDAEGAGIPFVPSEDAGGSVGRVGVDSSGAGRKATRGASEANLGINAEGAGRKAIALGFVEIINVTSDGAGRKSVANGSTDHIGVSAEGAGSAGIVGGGRPKVWNGSAWVENPVKVWTGSAWIEKPMKVWTGSEWEKV